MYQLTDKKNLFHIGAVLIVVLLVGVVLFMQNAGLKEKTASQGSEAMAIEPEEIQAVITEAGEKQDVLFCKKIKNEKKQEQCVGHVVLTIALDKQDPVVCERLENEIQAGACKNNVFFGQAVGNRDSSFCDKISDETFSARCHKAIAELP